MAAPDTTSVINQAMNEAGIAGQTDDAQPAEAVVEESSGGDGEGEEAPAASVVAEETPAPPAKEPSKGKELSDEEKELEALLEEHGFPKPKPGAKEGLSTRTRFRAVLGKELKRAQTRFQEGLSKQDLKKLSDSHPGLAQVLREVQIKRDLEAVASTDGERYLKALAQAYPNLYGKYLSAPAPAAPKTEDLGPMPQPDVQFQDGSRGYSPEQYDRRIAWDVKKQTMELETRLRSEYDKRLTPFERQQKATEERQRMLPKVQEQMARVTKLFGKLFTDDLGDPANPRKDAEIVAAMAAAPDRHFESVAMELYLPKLIAGYEAQIKELKTDRQKMRESILDELEKAPRGAGAPPAAVPGGGKSGPRSVEDVIRDSMSQAGM